MADNGPTVPLDVPTMDFETSEEEPSNVWARLIPLATNGRSFPVIDLISDSHTFGRAANCDTKFTELGISGKHCRIYKETLTSAKTSTDIVKIEDTSTNGTYVNGVALKKQNMLLSAGDVITFLNTGETEIKFVFKPNDNRSKHDKDLEGPHKDYDIGSLLGSGQFASVHLCIHKATGQQWAVKIIDKKKFAISSSTDRPDALLGEVEILKKLDHPSCIKIKETFETNDTLYLILELVTGGELFDKIVEARKFEEPRAREYFRQMLQAIKYLHDMGIVHRDLKPENILLKSRTEDVIKLSDFGLSRIMDGGSNMKTMCGTPQYVAPEVLTYGGTATAVGYGKACDLWSLGVILYILLAGYPPFYEEGRDMPLFEQITSAAFAFPDRSWAEISMEAKDLICQLLTVDAASRMDANGALNHPWMNGGKLTESYATTLKGAIFRKNAGKLVSITPLHFDGAKYVGETPSKKVNGSKNGNSSPTAVPEEEEEEEEVEEAPKAKVTKPKAAGKKAKAVKATKATTSSNGSESADEEDGPEEEEEIIKPAKAGKKATAAKKTAKASAAKKGAAKKSAAKAIVDDEEEDDLPPPSAASKKRKMASEPEEGPEVASPPKRAKR